MNTDRRGFLAGLLALPVILRVGARPEVGAQEPRVGSPAPTPAPKGLLPDYSVIEKLWDDTARGVTPNFIWMTPTAYRQATRTRLTRTR